MPKRSDAITAQTFHIVATILLTGILIALLVK
jgi:hypothetical protein